MKVVSTTVGHLERYAFDISKERTFCPEDNPLFRWAGGKKRLLKYIIPLLPPRARIYYEPFFGGGALFFALSPISRLALISDSNTELINSYRQIVRNPKLIIDGLLRLDYSKDTYYEIRDTEFTNNLDRAVKFIYLNRTCWNGLYRVNRSGRFNVPMGRFTSEPLICDQEKIMNVSKKLKGARLLAVDFEEASKTAEKGDFVYFDPPYISRHQDNGFRYYNEDVFSWTDQERLAVLSRALRKKGVNLMISNSANNDVLDLFKDFNIHILNRYSVISGKPEGRGKVSEVIITSYPTNKISTIDGWGDN